MVTAYSLIETQSRQQGTEVAELNVGVRCGTKHRLENLLPSGHEAMIHAASACVHSTAGAMIHIPLERTHSRIIYGCPRSIPLFLTVVTGWAETGLIRFQIEALKTSRR